MKKYVILVATTLVLTVGIFYRMSAVSEAVPVKTATVETGEIIGVVNGEGSILERGSRQIMGIDGSAVALVLVREGDQVKKGDPLVQLSDGKMLSSPLDGTVKQVAALAGMPTSSSIPLMTVGTSGDLVAKVMVPEKSISKVQPGQRVTVTAAALPGRLYDGVVESIASYARQSIGKKSNPVVVETTVRLYGDVEGLKPGYTANAEIVTYENKKALMVPFEAIVTKEGKEYIWTLQSGKAVMQQVEIGEETESCTELRSGAVQGETVILNPTEEIAVSGRIEVVS